MEMETQDEERLCVDIQNGMTGPSLQPSFRKGGRSSLEKVLLVLVAALLIALVAVVVVLILAQNRGNTVVHQQQQPSDGKYDVCLTKDCVAAAARIQSYIDYSVPSCDNFYEFACGKWIKETVIPSDKSYHSTFGLLSDQVYIVLKNLLEEDDKPEDLGCIKKVKDLYKSCMNTDLINNRGDQPLQDLLITEFSGWPLTTGNWSEDNFDFVQTLVRLNLYNMNPVISLYVSADNKNSSRHVLKIDQPSFGMPGQKYYKVPRNNTMLMAYEELIYKVGELLGFANRSLARQEVADIVNFEIELANISVPAEDRRDSNTLYNPMTLAEVQGNYSSVFNWHTYVDSLMSRPEIGRSDVTNEEIIINQSPLYYQRLIQLLNTTSERTLANYCIWRIVGGLISRLGENYRNVLRAYRKAVFGTSSDPARYQVCVGYSTSTFGLAVGRMFIKDNFDVDSKHIAMNMINGLQSSFNSLLDDLDWMDEHTKKVAREKNENISPKIGYPEEVTNNTYLEEYYSNYTNHQEKYFENTLGNIKEVFYKNMRQLRQVVDKNKWESPPSTVNAYYNSLKNQIMFPAGILQPPFFSKKFPMSLNFGAIGGVIGHEITHGFDDRGRQYDKSGNLIQWWSQSAVDKFKDKAKCIIEQYGNFTLPEFNLTLNGINTQGENIADNGGLKQSFKAYKNWAKTQSKEEPLLPGLDFNHDQLFFISFAQIWCNLITEGGALNSIQTGVHSPGRFRVIGSFQNSPDFAKAFNCPANSYMNPQKKCTVW